MELQHLADIVERECRLNRDQPVLVGVSGGPDSLCLLHALNRLQYPLLVAHFNHQLRPESHQDSARVAEEAARLRLPFLPGSQDVAAFAEEEGFSLEEAARVLRYRFLFAQARELDAQAVAVGHTADDQVETVLMHFLRGTGLAGLRGMAYRSLIPDWDAHIPVVRPLLSTWREETLAYCAENDLVPVEDASNQDRAFFRNRLRHELIPVLETYNPQARKAIWRMSQVLAGDEELARQALEISWQAVYSTHDSNSVQLKLAETRSLPPGALRAVLRKAVGLLLPAARDIDYAAVERAGRFLRKPSPGRVDLVQGLCLFREGGGQSPGGGQPAGGQLANERLVIQRSGEPQPEDGWPRLDFAGERELEIPGSIGIAAGWRLSGEWVELERLPEFGEPGPGSAWEAWLDAATLPGQVAVRRPRPGDRFQPLGMGGHSMKLSDFWINEKHPRRARAAWPLVVSGGQVVWIPGFRLADPFRLKRNTRKALHLRLFRAPDRE